MLVDIPKLITAYYSERPDPQVAAQRVAFGTSGHRGSSLEIGFNESHVLSISQAICEYRKLQNIDGPLFMGFDTHALSAPAFASALEVLAANGVDIMIAPNDEYTPTPAVSLAILNYNRGRSGGMADGIVITPSHNPPDSGGFKYNPPNGGPADTDVTRWIETRANELLQSQAGGVKRMALNLARRAPTTHPHDYLQALCAGSRQCFGYGCDHATRKFAWASTRWAAPACITGRESPSSTASILTWSTMQSIPPFDS